jgi:sortase (surface protein transpeptidase)
MKKLLIVLLLLAGLTVIAFASLSSRKSNKQSEKQSVEKKVEKQEKKKECRRTCIFS